MSAQPRICFVISPIGESKSDVRIRSDTLLQHIISPVVTPYGYEVVRADNISEAGDITIQIIHMLLNADLVIADLTEHNANVFYELAVRHATRKPVIHLMAEGTHTPFDVRQFRAISYDVFNVATSEACKGLLNKQVASFNTGKPIVVTNTIALAVDIDLLQQRENVVERSYAGLLEAVKEIQQDLEGLTDGLDSVTDDLYDRLGELSEKFSDYTKEPPLTAEVHVKAFKALISSFNTLDKSAYEASSEIPESLHLNVRNLRSYLRGLVFQSPLSPPQRDELDGHISNFIV